MYQFFFRDCSPSSFCDLEATGQRFPIIVSATFFLVIKSVVTCDHQRHSLQKFVGVYQQGSLTGESLIWILSNVLLVIEDDWTIKHRESSRTITPSSNPDYDILSESMSCSGPLANLLRNCGSDK